MLVFSVAGNPINANISYHAPISHRRKLGADEHTDSAITNATELLQHLVLRIPEPVLKKHKAQDHHHDFCSFHQDISLIKPQMLPQQLPSGTFNHRWHKSYVMLSYTVRHPSELSGFLLKWRYYFQ